MTADDWDNSTDARRMLSILYPVRSEGSRHDGLRLLRLYMVALARRKFRWFNSDAQLVLEWIERFPEDPLAVLPVQSTLATSIEGLSQA
ncbi:MAG: hypothetical protein ACRCZF_07040, partial [Gemmataceae bacterium]